MNPHRYRPRPLIPDPWPQTKPEEGAELKLKVSAKEEIPAEVRLPND